MGILPSRRAASAIGVAVATALAGLAAAAPASAKNGDFEYTVHPLAVQYTSAGAPFQLPAPSQCVAAYGLACYTPELIRTAYGIPDDWTGAGTTIAIVDAYGSPTAAPDLAAFSEEFGLPPADLHIYYPGGKPKSQAAHQGIPLGWAGETSLDLQWAHAIAPEARINLVVAANPGGTVLNNAVRYAVDNDLGDVLSMSFGADEARLEGNNLQIAQAHAIFAAAAAKGITVFASAGDGGAANGYPVANASYPASDPAVTSVGGTNLFVADDGTYQSETVWNDDDPTLCAFGCSAGPLGATGGAPSAVFAADAFQASASGLAARTTSDVSYNASVYTGVMVYQGFHANPAENGLFFMGGTSAGAPQWAAIAALAVEQAGHRLGFLNDDLYALAASPEYSSAFHDVTVGNNAFQGPGFPAASGYDIPTGLGSPRVAGLVAALID